MDRRVQGFTLKAFREFRMREQATDSLTNSAVHPLGYSILLWGLRNGSLEFDTDGLAK